MAPLSMLAVFACSPGQFQQSSEYDDVYFTSADRKVAPQLVAKPVAVQEAEAANIITLSNQSKASVDPALLSRYSNSDKKQVEYFVEGEVEPRVARADDLNYDDFIWDYENEMLSTYALPVDWTEEWNRGYFNNLVNNDFEFRLAWYDQYYTGNSTRMDRYITASNGRIGRTSMSTFGGNRFGNNFGNGFFNPGFNVSIGIGRGFGFNDPFFGRGFGFNDPFFGGGGFGWFNDPFFGGGFGYDPFFDPFFYRGSIWGRRNGFNRWNRGWGSGFGFGNNFYCPPIFSNQYIYRGEVIIANNNRSITRGGRIASTSVASVRSDASSGVAQTRSQRLASAAGTSRLSRSSVDNRASRTGRVSSSSQVAGSVSNRVRTDAYRFNDSRTSSRSSSRVATSSSRSSRNAVTSRTSRSNPAFNAGRTSSRNTTNGVSFNRNSSSRSSSRVSPSSARGVSRSSSRSSSSNGFSRGTSSSRSSSSSSRSVSSSSSRSSGSSSSSSRGSSSGSSSGRGSGSGGGGGRGGK